MLHNKKTIVYVQPNKIKVAVVASEKDELKVVKSAEFFCNELDDKAEKGECSLVDVFSKVKEGFDKSVRVLISENHSYLTTFPVATAIHDVADKVYEMVTEILPEEPDDIIYDWKELYLNEESQERMIQIFAIPKGILKKISFAAQEAGVFIEAIEPASYSLARLTEDVEVPHLVLANDTQAIGVVSFQGGVLVSMNLDEASYINDLLAFVKDKFEMVVEQIVVPQEMGDIDHPVIKDLGLEVVERELDPVLGIYLKDDLKGIDSEILNIEPLLIKIEQADPEENEVMQTPIPEAQMEEEEDRYSPAEQGELLEEIKEQESEAQAEEVEDNASVEEKNKEVEDDGGETEIIGDKKVTFYPRKKAFGWGKKLFYFFLGLVFWGGLFLTFSVYKDYNFLKEAGAFMLEVLGE